MEIREGNYRGQIRVREVDRPLADYRYFAKVTYMIRAGDSRNKQIDGAQFGEIWGITEGEAEAEMRHKVREWVAAKG